MLASGAILQDRYRILYKLAQGGMGMVYLAEDQRFRNSKVALKEARREGIEIRIAFEREAELLHQLRHPALPHVTDYFTEDSKQYLVMQFIPGMTLEELLVERQQKGDGPFATDQVLLWADQLLETLEYLHEHRPPIIHRDIKPQNLKLTPRGEIVLLDFGLAKGAATETSQVGESIRGYTRHYAPLEQIEGIGTDPRSDLYSLAATLYRLLTGVVPADALTRASAVLQGRPDPLFPANELNPQVSTAVAKTLSFALIQNPDERPATAREMRSALGLLRQSDRGDSSVSVGQQPRKEIFVSPIEEPGISITQLETIPNLESTFVGQAMPTAESSQLAFQPEGASVPSRGRNQWMAPITAMLIGIFILVIIVLVYRYRNSERVESRISPSLTGSPSQMAEVMSCSLELEKSGTRVSVSTPLLPGEWFKLHFTTRQPGYLYIIAPDENDVPMLLLNAQPNPDWGVKTNLIEAGKDFGFPPRPDKWLRITGDVNAETYLVIFAPAPLNSPACLTRPAGAKLTAAEVAELRQQFNTGARTEMSRDHAVVKVPTTSPGEPFAFDIKVEIERPPSIRQTK